jgi:hypothetical protein
VFFDERNRDAKRMNDVRNTFVASLTGVRRLGYFKGSTNDGHLLVPEMWFEPLGQVGIVDHHASVATLANGSGPPQQAGHKLCSFPLAASNTGVVKSESTGARPRRQKEEDLLAECKY